MRFDGDLTCTLPRRFRMGMKSNNAKAAQRLEIEANEAIRKKDFAIAEVRMRAAQECWFDAKDDIRAYRARGIAEAIRKMY